jgi:hypothetical protein
MDWSYMLERTPEDQCTRRTRLSHRVLAGSPQHQHVVPNGPFPLLSSPPPPRQSRCGRCQYRVPRPRFEIRACSRLVSCKANNRYVITQYLETYYWGMHIFKYDELEWTIDHISRRFDRHHVVLPNRPAATKYVRCNTIKGNSGNCRYILHPKRQTWLRKHPESKYICTSALN